MASWIQILNQYRSRARQALDLYTRALNVAGTDDERASCHKNMSACHQKVAQGSGQVTEVGSTPGFTGRSVVYWADCAEPVKTIQKHYFTARNFLDAQKLEAWTSASAELAQAFSISRSKAAGWQAALHQTFDVILRAFRHAWPFDSKSLWLSWNTLYVAVLDNHCTVVALQGQLRAASAGP